MLQRGHGFKVCDPAVDLGKVKGQLSDIAMVTSLRLPITSCHLLPQQLVVYQLDVKQNHIKVIEHYFKANKILEKVAADKFLDGKDLNLLINTISRTDHNSLQQTGDFSF